MLHFYGVDEATILTTWTLARFRAYRDFAMQLLKTRSL